MANVNAIGWSAVLAHVYACGVRGDEGEGTDSSRFQPPNLGKAVCEAVGEMCPYPAPAIRPPHLRFP
jgi:hypothetical protein